MGPGLFAAYAKHDETRREDVGELQGYPLDRIAYRRRNVIERMFCRMKDYHRIATRYDKLTRNFLSTRRWPEAIARSGSFGPRGC